MCHRRLLLDYTRSPASSQMSLKCSNVYQSVYYLSVLVEFNILVNQMIKYLTAILISHCSFIQHKLFYNLHDNLLHSFTGCILHNLREVGESPFTGYRKRARLPIPSLAPKICDDGGVPDSISCGGSLGREVLSMVVLREIRVRKALPSQDL